MELHEDKPNQASGVQKAIPKAAHQAQPVSRLEINDTKAGMQNIDKEKINAIILKHSQSKLRLSSFFLLVHYATNLSIELFI
jgi:hypothetical protein